MSSESVGKMLNIPMNMTICSKAFHPLKSLVVQTSTNHTVSKTTTFSSQSSVLTSGHQASC